MIAGLLTFLDPPKETAGPAIAALRENGVAVKVLTGDNPVVSAKICREVGLDVGEPLLGRDIDLMDDATLQRLAEERTVFAKLTPLQKSRVLKACRATDTPSASSATASTTPGAARCRCRHLGGQRHRHRQGIGRHHPPGKA